jgi:hypothetical protein
MLEFLLGFGLGVLFGTKYNCKPYIDVVLNTVKYTLKDIKSDFKHENNDNVNNDNGINDNIVDEILLSTRINNELKKEN